MATALSTAQQPSMAALVQALFPLGVYLDQYDAHRLPTAQPEVYRQVAHEARQLVARGLTSPVVRRACIASPALLELLEAELYARQAPAMPALFGKAWKDYGHAR